MKSSKGAAFERELAKRFSLWWTQDTRDDVFWRSSNSGGRATVRRRAGKKTFGHCGDLAATDPIGQPFLNAVTVELKCGYTKCVFADALDRADHLLQSEWEGFIEQARRAARNAETPHWLLITRRNKRRAVLFMSMDLYGLLLNKGWNNPGPKVRMSIDLKSSFRKIVRVNVLGIILDDFLETCPPKFFKYGLS